MSYYIELHVVDVIKSRASKQQYTFFIDVFDPSTIFLNSGVTDIKIIHTGNKSVYSFHITDDSPINNLPIIDVLVHISKYYPLLEFDLLIMDENNIVLDDLIII